jgi:hypothetical protein
MKTKKLTFLLALTFLFLFSGSVFGGDKSEEKKILLICESYSHFDWSTNETSTVSDPPSSMIIYPDLTVIQIKDRIINYKKVGTKIVWSSLPDELFRWDHILDRVTGVYETNFHMKKNGEFQKKTTHTQKCKKTESLF